MTRPQPGDPISQIFVGATDAATFAAVAAAAGVLIAEGEAQRPGLGVTIIGPYARVVTPGVYDPETGAETTPPVMGAGVSYTVGVDASWIARMIDAGDDLTTTPADLIAHWQTHGAAVTRDGVAAHELSGVWIWAERPPGATVIAGAV